MFSSLAGEQAEKYIVRAYTNNRCSNCSGSPGVTKTENIRTLRRYSQLEPFDQPMVPGFPCPVLLADGGTCKCIIFGMGQCLGCQCYQLPRVDSTLLWPKPQ